MALNVSRPIIALSARRAISKFRRRLPFLSYGVIYQKIPPIAIFPISANAPLLNYSAFKQRNLNRGYPPY